MCFSKGRGGCCFFAGPLFLDCYWVGSLDFNCLVEIKGFSTKQPKKLNCLLGGQQQPKCWWVRVGLWLQSRFSGRTQNGQLKSRVFDTYPNSITTLWAEATPSQNPQTPQQYSTSQGTTGAPVDFNRGPLKGRTGIHISTNLSSVVPYLKTIMAHRVALVPLENETGQKGQEKPKQRKRPQKL